MKQWLLATALSGTMLFAADSANALEWGLGCKDPADLKAWALEDLSAAKTSFENQACTLAYYLPEDKASGLIRDGSLQMRAYPYPGIRLDEALQKYSRGDHPQPRLLFFLDSIRERSVAHAR